MDAYEIVKALEHKIEEVRLAEELLTDASDVYTYYMLEGKIKAYEEIVHMMEAKND